jgi:bifunctional non-homologous end joining protein LigD
VPTGDGWVHEVKFDGYRVQAHKAGSRVLVFSRNGHDFTDRFAQTRATTPMIKASPATWNVMQRTAPKVL